MTSAKAVGSIKSKNHNPPAWQQAQLCVLEEKKTPGGLLLEKPL